jgi:hypothetical protein
VPTAGEALVGARAYRVLFALVSLPLALVCVVYFINHRYSGAALWDVRGVPGVHEAVWALSFVSFLFLYPSTFNILEVAAVDEPKLHLWETGITRITRHPQVVACAAAVAAGGGWLLAVAGRGWARVRVRVRVGGGGAGGCLPASLLRAAAGRDATAHAATGHTPTKSRAGVWPGAVVRRAHAVGGQQLHGGYLARAHGAPRVWLLAWRQAAGRQVRGRL